jgi:hypothetical protein
MARGGHELPKVSLGPTMPDPSGGPPLKRPYSHFSDGPPAGRPVAIFYPFGHPTPYASGLNKQIPRGAGFCESSAKLCIKSRGATHVKWKVFCLHALSQLGREQSTSISLPTNHNQSQPVTMQPIRTDSPSLEKNPFEFVSHFIATMHYVKYVSKSP